MGISRGQWPRGGPVRRFPTGLVQVLFGSSRWVTSRGPCPRRQARSAFCPVPCRRRVSLLATRVRPPSVRNLSRSVTVRTDGPSIPNRSVVGAFVSDRPGTASRAVSATAGHVIASYPGPYRRRVSLLATRVRRRSRSMRLSPRSSEDRIRRRRCERCLERGRRARVAGSDARRRMVTRSQARRACRQ